MKKQTHNVGFTYSNLSNRQSVIVIGKHDTKSQLINTIAHESRHLQQHIADVYDIKADGEQVCYLIGAINQIIFDYCNSLNLFD